MKTDAKRSTIIEAINAVNWKAGYKIELNRDDYKGKWFNFTIKSKSGIPGARTSTSGRNLACASWHAHGYLFEEIFNIEPRAVIYSCGKMITKDKGNWIDMNIGSCYASKTSII
jgi:hypothetical protein